MQEERRDAFFRPSPVGAIVLVVIAALVAIFFNVVGLRDRLKEALGIRQAAIKSIAVLPLQNLSGDPGQEYLADGMTDSVITELGRFKTLRVISHTSTRQYKDKNKTVPEIARELNVDAIVAGSVLREGGRVRITARLLRTSPEKQIWVESYNRDLGDVLALEAELAQDIARQVNLTVTPQASARLKALRQVKPEAHQAYLRGRYFWSKRSPEGMRKAVEYFQQAIDLDPNYATPYAGLADAYGVRAGRFLGLDRKERFAKVKQAAQKALEIDPSLAESHTALAHIKSYEWDWAGAQRELQRAIELNPSYATAHLWLSDFLIMQGRYHEGIVQVRRALDLDPLSPVINWGLGFTFYTFGRQEQAIHQCKIALELDPKSSQANWCLALAYLALGQEKRASRYARKSFLLEDGPRSAAEMANRYESKGWPGIWRWYAEKLEAEQINGEYVNSVFIAEAYVRIGETDRAIRALETGFQEHDTSVIFVRGDPILKPLYSDSRFQSLLRRIDLPPR